MRRFAKSDKVADLLKHAISNALLLHLGDPRLRWITLTDVRLTRDLSVAWVYYTVLEDQLDRDAAARAITENLRELKRYLAQHLRLRQLPEIRFRFDTTEEQARRIETLLDGISRDPGDSDGT